MALINNHFNMEKTDGTCDKCTKPRYIRRAIFNFPPLLIIQMKRYTGQAKNTVPIDIQFQLNSGLFGNKNANVNYDLSAIVCHDGQSIYYGHYIAYCKDEDLNWREYNDLKSVRLVDFTEKNTQDYIFCSQNSYLIFYTLPETTNLDAVSSIEQKFSQMMTADFELISEKNSSSDKMDIEEFDNENVSFDDDNQKDSLKSLSEDDMHVGDDDDDDEKQNEEVIDGPENYTIINGQAIFFNNCLDEESVSGLLSINNIMCRKIYFEKELDEAKEIWTSFNDLELLLNSNAKVLQKISLRSFIDDNKTDTFLIDQEKHYYVLKRFIDNGPLFMLDPIKSNPTICESNIWDTCKRRLNKYKEKEAISVYKVVQSNSSIIINPINADKEPHAENYGKSNSCFVI